MQREEISPGPETVQLSDGLYYMRDTNLRNIHKWHVGVHDLIMNDVVQHVLHHNPPTMLPSVFSSLQ